MVKTVLLVVAVALLYWLYNMKKKKVFKRNRPIERRLTTISGSEIQTFLSADTPLECLAQDGVRFGESFRLKEISPLPHNEQCRCKIVNLSYTSEEVFQGALREDTHRESTIGRLDYKEASLLKSMLQNMHTDSDTASFEVYCQQFDLSSLSSEREQQFIELVREKYENLKNKPQLAESDSENLEEK